MDQNQDTLGIIDIKQIQIDQQPELESISFCDLFRFAKRFDYILMVIGSIGAAALGAALPAFALLWGSITDSFGEGPDQMVDSARIVMFQFLYIGAGAFVASWLMFGCWMITGERQAIQCRKQYLKALLKQQIGWYDMKNQSQISSSFASDCFAFQGAIGEKVSSVIMTISMMIAGFIIAFIKGWLMAVVVLATIPGLMIGGFIYLWVIGNSQKNRQKNYSEAGGKAQQAISSIKTVKQLNGQIHQSQSYKISLAKASQNIVRFSLLTGAGIGFVFFVMLASYSLGFWWGSILVQRKQYNSAGVNNVYNPGDVLVIFFSILMSGFNLSQLSPAFEKITLGKQAGARIFNIIDRVPLISSPINGRIPQNFKGQIKFEDVSFYYPKDKKRKILDKINLDFNFRSIALVGESGCGKSTILQLLMRFYDPNEGRITLDSIDLKQIDLAWLRQNIGYVGQEPVLFAASIRENMLFGKQNATQQEIQQALRKAQAYDFVQTLQKKLDTYVGYGGSQLSGGQKQRLAIARAILKCPKILLLDEATSALDRRNQKLIQKTLDKIAEDRISITVAHRVKTIMNSEKIYVLQKGHVLESGKFQQLSRYKGQKIQRQIEQKEADRSPTKKQEDIQIIELKNDGKQNESILMTKQEKQKLEQKQITKKYQKQVFSRLFKYSSDKLPLTIVGVCIALCNGLIFPIFAIFLSKMLTVLFQLQIYQTQSERIIARDQANLDALIFLILGIAGFFTNFFQKTIFNIVGSSITNKLRIQTYQKILKMPVYWFDIPRNNAGTLAARLSTDCQIVNGLTTTFIAITIQNVSSLIAGVVIAFVYEWRVALISLGLLPFMILAGIIQMAFKTGFSDKTDAAYKDSSNLIMETMLNIRTVASFGYQNIIAQKYQEKLEQPFNLAILNGNISGVLFGFSQLIMFVVFALIFFLGTVFIRDNQGVDINGVFTAIYAIMFAGMTAGNNAHFMPDAEAAKNSASNLFLIQDGQDQQQLQINQKSKLLKEGCLGDIQFKNIGFKYDGRKEDLFKNFSLTIKEGKKVAFVGTSGCGKSTIMQLLMRFYNLSEGQIIINGINIKDFDIHYLRSCYGVVSQQPVLFNGSFKDNIQYNKKNVTMNQIEEASKKANALSFILGEEQLVEQVTSPKKKSNKKINNDQIIEIPQIGVGQTGFNRGVGVKGSHISGGQKQRIAIARAILRQPQILLLDEATSALDSNNEKIVQESLDLIMKNKTTITIAHRLQTIHNSDEICVFEKGHIIEKGNYANLMNIKGYFYNLQKGVQFV